MKTFKRNQLLGAVALAAAIASGPASAGAVFLVDEGVVPGSFANTVTADLIDFSYNATINQSMSGPTLNGEAGDSFTEIGTIAASSFKLFNVSQPSQLNGLALAGGYGIVGNFTATGTAGILGAGIRAIFSTFELDLYLDTNQDNIGDMLLGSGMQNAYSEANIFGGLANGDFDVNMFFTATAFGLTYFVDPTPFNLNMEVTGVTSTITGAGAGAFTAQAQGSGNLVVDAAAVPEPSTLAIFGLALSGLALSQRRRNA